MPNVQDSGVQARCAQEQSTRQYLVGLYESLEAAADRTIVLYSIH
jgi:hypothetical protein